MANLQRRSGPRKEHVCSVCHEACSFLYIFCDTCSQWVHTACDGIEEEQRKQFERLPLDFPYICRKCRCDEEGSLDYGKALMRLHKAAIQGYKKLQTCVRREDLFLDGPFDGMSGVGSLPVDMGAQALMERFLPQDRGIPAVTSTLDHALFRAVSLAVSAKDSMAYELRVRCCIEMVKHEHYYRFQRNFQILTAVAPEYSDSCLDCALMDEGSSVWTLSALATVIKRPIMSVYPPINGQTDPAVQTLNTYFKSRDGEISSQLVRILWTSEDENIVVGKWRPNHFVPLFDQQKQESPVKSNPRHHFQDSLGAEGDDADNFEAEAEPLQEPAEEEMEMEPVTMEVAQGGSPIEFGRFMDVFEAFEKINTATVIQSEIPRGLKENVWFLVDNTRNMQNPHRRNTFFDDCGVWDSKHGSVAKSHLFVDDSDVLCTLKIHGGVFKRLSKAKGKQQWVPIEPQPDPDRVVVCHRYYAFLKRSTQYKRRIIWFTMPPSHQQGRDVALVEYLGKFPGHPKASLGSSSRRGGRGRSRNYIRTDPRLLEDIANQIRLGSNMSPLKMFNEIQKTLGPNSTLRDPRQIRNLKYAVTRQKRKEDAQKFQGDDAGKVFATTTSTAVSELPGTAEIHAAGIGTEMGGTPIKVIIQQAGDEMEGGGEELPEGTKLVEIEEGQQAISFINTDPEGLSDPTQTIIMLRDFGAELSSNEVIVTQAL